MSTANPAGIVVNCTPPTATDNEDQNPTVTCNKASGSLFSVGQNTVLCAARDANGNESSDTFTIMVDGLHTVGGTVPATLSLTLGAPAQFGAFTLPQALQARANDGIFARSAARRAPTSLLTYAAPVSNDSATVEFKQTIGAADPLRTGTYSKTLTFTLSTTTP